MLPRQLDSLATFPPPAPERWRAAVDLDLNGAPFEKKLITHTYEGLDLRPLYTRADWDNSTDPHGFSGLPPMTRGSSPLASTARGWDIWQEHAHRDLALANSAILDDLAGGVSTLVLRLDACARSGCDPDDPLATPLVGVDGLMLHALDDFSDLLRGVHLHMVGIALESGAAFVPGALLLAGAWSHAHLAKDQCRGAFQADPLAVLARDGHLPYSLDSAFAQLGSLAQWTSRHYPHVTSVRVGTAPYHHAGATATQDLAFSMATALEYLRAMTAAGLSIDAAALQMRFSFAVGCNMFLAIAKLRAARRLWARLIEASGGKPASGAMRMHVRASRRVLTTRDPWINILRNTACVLGAALAGADAIGSTPFDAPLGPPSPLARRLARNTHHVLMEECHVHRVADPAGGSFYLDRLTDDLARAAWSQLQAIESAGGFAKCLLSGSITSQIDSALQPRIRNIATRKDGVLGVSEFPNLDEHRPVPPKDDADHHARRIRTAIDRARAGRATAAPHLQLPRASPASLDDLFAAAKSGATIAQLFAHTSPAPRTPLDLPHVLHVHTYAEPFERLREASDHFKDQCGHRPRIFLISLGTPANHLARTNYASNLFEAGGFEVIHAPPDLTSAQVASALAQSAAHIAIICGSDDAYPDSVPPLAQALRSAGAHRVILAGNPAQHEAAYRAAGVDQFVFIRCDVVSILRDLLHLEGVEA